MYLLDEKLKRDDSGPGVVALYEYLHDAGYVKPRYGLRGLRGIQLMISRYDLNKYFNDLPDPQSPDVFDEEMEKAVKSLQEFYGLEETGEVNDVTLERVRQPRCRIPDLKGITFDKDKARPICAWKNRRLKWHVAQSPNGINLQEFRKAFIEMLETWKRFAKIDLNFEEGTLGSHLQAFTYNGDGSGGVYAYAHFPCDGRASGDQYYDANDAWSLANNTPRERADLKSVLLHELGHALGLGHTRDSLAVMYPSIAFGDQKREPKADDIAGIRELYP